MQDGVQISLLDYCNDSNFKSSLIKIAKLLWTNEEFKTHLIIEPTRKFRKDTTIQKPFTEEPDLHKIELVGVFYLLFLNIYAYFNIYSFLDKNNNA